MSKSVRPRPTVTTGNFFASFPQIFKGAPESFRHFFKVNIQTVRRKDGKLVPAFSPNVLLLDLAMIPQKLNLAQLSRDCDIVKEIVRNKPEQIHTLVKTFHHAMNAPGNHFGEVARLTKKMGLDERSFASKGGGCFFLIFLLVVACGSCMTSCPPTRTAVDEKKGEGDMGR